MFSNWGAFWGNTIIYSVIIAFLVINLKPKNRRTVAFLVIFELVETVALLYTTTNIVPRAVVAYAPPFIALIVIIIVFQGPIAERIFVLLFAFASNFIVVFLVEMPLAATRMFDTMDEWVGFWYAVLEAALLACTFLIFTLLKNKYITTQDYGKILWAFLLFPLSQTMSFFMAFMAMDKGEVLGFQLRLPSLYILNAAATLICVIADTVLFIIMLRTASNKRLQQELQFQEYQNQTKLEYYQMMEQDALETRKIKHDLKNMLQVAFGLVQEDGLDSRPQAESLLTEIEETIHTLDIVEYSGNPLVNAIISSKAKQCKIENVQLEVKIALPKELPLPDFDICRAFTNLLDNAFHATLQIPDSKRRFVVVEAFLEEPYFYLKVANPTREQNGTINKRKGYGTSILQDLAEKYQGRLVTEQKEGYYTALLALRLQ